MALTSGLDSLNIDQATDQPSNQTPDQPVVNEAPAAPQPSNEEAILSKALDDHQKQKLLLNQQIQKMSEGFSQRQNQFIDPKLAAMSAAFLDPGKTGSFGEAFGRAVKGYGEAATEEDKQIKENAKMRLDLMKTSISENEKNLIAQLTPKLFKVNDKGAYTGEVDPVIAQKIVSISGDPSMIQKIIEMSKPQIGELAPGASTYDKKTGKIIFTNPKEATPSDLKKKEDELAKLKEDLAKDPTNETLKRNVKYHEDDLKKLEQLEFPDEVLDALARQALAGDTSVFVNVGRGTQGPNNLVRLRTKMTQIMKDSGMNPGDIAAKNAEFFGFKAGERTLGTRSANLELAAQGFLNIVPIAQIASNRVSRSKFLPFGKIQIMFDENFNDPDVSQFAAANNGLVNTYARAISPTGVPTVSDKNHAREILAMAKNKESYDRAVETLQKEIEAEQRAPREVRANLRSEISGTSPASTPDNKPTNKPAGGKHYLRNREIVVRGGKWVFADTGEDAK